MTLVELHYIVTLATERHFGRAARRCCVSQPTLSMAVKRLEDELGLALFERDSTGVRLTPPGEQIVARAKVALAHTDTIRRLAEAKDNPLQGPIALGALPTIGPYWLPLLIARLTSLGGQLSLRTEEEEAITLRDKLCSGQLDAALVTLPFHGPELVTRPLFDEPLAVLMPSQHPLAHKAAVDPSDLLQHNLLLPKGAPCLREQILHIVGTLRPAGAGGVEAASLETLRHMVACGLGIAVIPRSAVSGNFLGASPLTVRPFAPPEPSRTLALAWRSSFPRSGTIDMLIEALQACNNSHWQEIATTGAEEAVFMANRHW